MTRFLIGAILLFCLHPFDVKAKITEQTCNLGNFAGITVRCGALTVPESRAGKNNIRLELPYVVFRPALASTKAPPVLILTGGPGGVIDIHRRDGIRSWIKYVHGFQRAGPRDVILFAQRGTDNRLGENLACSALQSPEIALAASRRGEDRSNWQADFLTALENCRDQALAAGHDLYAYSTPESVKDIAVLKNSLAITDWVIYGVSYGTRLALEVARDSEAGISALILDSPSPPASPHAIQDAALLARSLQKLTDICNGLWRCRALSQNVYEDALDRLGQLRKKPIRLALRKPNGGPRYDVEMTDALFSQLILLAFYHPDAIAQIPRTLARLKSGHRDTLRNLADQLFMTPRNLHIGTYASVRCQNQNPRHLLASLNNELESQPNFQAMIIDQIWLNENLCHTWLPDYQPNEGAGPVTSSVRTFILSGDLDPVTPSSSATFLQQTMPNATVKIYPDTSHGVLEFLTCAWDDVELFLNGQPPLAETACRRHYSF